MVRASLKWGLLLWAVGCGPTTGASLSSSSSSSTTAHGTFGGAVNGASGTTSTNGPSTGSSATSSSSSSSSTTSGTGANGSSAGATVGSSSTSTVGSSSGDSTTSSSSSSGGPIGSTTGTSGTTSSSTTGSTGSCSGTIADARAAAPFSAICIPGMVTVLSSTYGNAALDGGTQFAGNWYMADATGSVIAVYKSKKLPVLNADPNRGDVVDVTGKVELFPTDGGTTQITGSTLNFTARGTGALPTPQAATVPQLSPTGSDDSLVGQYVHVPAGSYTQDNAAPQFQYQTYQDGLSLTDSSGNVMLVDTYTFKYSANNCMPRDGGFPDLSAGNFNAVFDLTQTDDGNLNKVLFYGHCGQ